LNLVVLMKKWMVAAWFKLLGSQAIWFQRDDQHGTALMRSLEGGVGPEPGDFGSTGMEDTEANL
jgi:hypothetical protein